MAFDTRGRVIFQFFRDGSTGYIPMEELSGVRRDGLLAWYPKDSENSTGTLKSHRENMFSSQRKKGGELGIHTR